MENRPDALLLKYPGTNCDRETARALEAAGFSPRVVPIALVSPETLRGAALVVLPGGFSYGDYIMAGRIADLETERRLADSLSGFTRAGGYILGICNGFQILMQLGLLPAGSLIANTSGRFICEWVELANHRPDNPFLHGLPDRFPLPIAHAEGRFAAREGKADQYRRDGLAPLTYADNPNGSQADIAGLQDESGRVFGLMPHPERYLYAAHHPDPAAAGSGDGPWGWGYTFFKSIHDHCSTQPAPAL